MGSSSSTKHETYTTAPTHGHDASTDPAATVSESQVQPEPQEPTPVPDDAALGSPDAADTPTVEQSDSAAEPIPDAPPADNLIVEASSDVVTPIPEAPPEGTAAGVPVLVGGADLVDSTATLVSYSAPEGGPPHEVLLATVDEAAEAKILDALALSEEKLIPVQVEENITGRLPVDEEKQLYELVAKAAKSVNHKLKTGVEIPQHTKDYLAAAQAALDTVHHNTASTPDEIMMGNYYQTHLDAVAEAITHAGAVAYNDGGKVPQVDAYLHTGMATVTKMVPAPVDDAPPGQLNATIRDAGRISAQIDTATATTSWDGHSRSAANGVEYAVDLGDGWNAVYRPYSANNPKKHEYSLRGQLEVHAPQGAGHGSELVNRLADLNLVNRPLTHAEGEWTYLKNNITAQGLSADPHVANSLAKAEQLEELQLQEIFHTHAHHAVGLDQPGLAKLAKQWQLDAAASCLPKKVRIVRQAVALATGHADGDALAASPGYDPAPRTSGGWLTWTRFDVGNQQEKAASAWKGKSLVHSVTGCNISDLLATGVLASTERRAVMGIQPGHGMSEDADKASGGAGAVFTRVEKTPKDPGGIKLIWDDPPRILNRTGIYGYETDAFGAINPENVHYGAMTRDPFAMAEFTDSANEVMFHHGLDLLGAEAPTRISCGNPEEKTKVLHLLTERGITHLAGKPIGDVVH